MWNEIHEYIRQMRTGLTVPSDNKYRTLRQIMKLYGEYGYSTETIRKISKEVNLSVNGEEKRVILEDVLQNGNLKTSQGEVLSSAEISLRKA
jgi:hypothetical protein